MMADATAIMLAVIVPVIVLTLAFAYWFRAGNPIARRLPDWEYSGRIELIVWSIPALIILFLGGMAWIGSHRVHPSRALESTRAPLRVEVVSLDWKWLFIYPDEGVATVNALVVPAGRPISFELTSASVMNSFFVPQFGSQIYTMAGMKTRLNLLADKPGDYQGFSAQFSGDGFSDMRFGAHVVTPDAFAAWTKTIRHRRNLLDAKAYGALARPSHNVPPAFWGEVAPGLFDQIVVGTARRRTPGSNASSQTRSEN